MRTVRHTTAIGTIGAIALTVGGCGPALGDAVPLTSDRGSSCDIRVSGGAPDAAYCGAAATIRFVGARFDAADDVVLAGAYEGRATFGTTSIAAPPRTRQAFVTKLGPDLAPRWLTTAPGPNVRALVTRGPDVDAIVADDDDGASTWVHIGAIGATERRPFAARGVVAGAEVDGAGNLLVALHDEGRHLVTLAPNGAVVASALLSPTADATLPASIVEGAIVGQIAALPDGARVVHSGRDDDGLGTTGRLAKVGRDGAIAWSRRAAVGSATQLVAIDGGVAIVVPRAGALCEGPLGATAAIVALDAEARPRFTRCLTGETRDLRLAAGPGAGVTLSAVFRGTVDLAGTAVHAAAGTVESVVVSFGPSGAPGRLRVLSGGGLVAIQALAVSPSGKTVVAGAASRDGHVPSRVFVARFDH